MEDLYLHFILNTFVLPQRHRGHRGIILFVCRETTTNKNHQFRIKRKEFSAEGLSCLYRIGISRFYITIPSLCALCLVYYSQVIFLNWKAMWDIPCFHKSIELM